MSLIVIVGRVGEIRLLPRVLRPAILVSSVVQWLSSLVDLKLIVAGCLLDVLGELIVVVDHVPSRTASQSVSPDR